MGVVKGVRSGGAEGDVRGFNDIVIGFSAYCLPGAVGDLS